MSKRFATALLPIFLVVALMPACQTVRQDTTPASQGTAIEATPVQQGENSWKIATANTVTLTVLAPGAKSVKIMYRPIVETDRHVVLKTVNSPVNGQSGKFSTSIKLVKDFAGEVWAEVTLADGTKKETDPIDLAAQDSSVAQTEGIPSSETENKNAQLNANNNSAAAAANKNAVSRKGESAKSDKFTGGKIEQSALQPNQPGIRITVNVPAFRLTLWQNGKEVKTYEIGVGMKKYPIVIGQRRITQIIWNPEWVPPDSEWVNESHSDVEPGEHIEAGDKRNPLGKIKIPLGDGFLMHQAAKPTDLGHLVSHGCIRILKEDISDIATKIVTARGVNITPQQIEHAMNSTDRLVAPLKPPIIIDIDYDTLVVEGGVLHIYPDVYDRETSTVENLRAELQSVGMDTSKLDDQTLKQMLDRVTPNEEFMVSVADLKAGNALLAGTKQPLTSQSVVAKKKQPAKGRHSSRGRK
ncbi:MAG TPA: L,D-transpeptidase [Blastocatellia bacterium]|nr:L,D-transpeptidase [Blastocatellia bacterium]